MIKDLFHFVQGRSSSYPIVHADSFYKYLFQHLKLVTYKGMKYTQEQFIQCMPQKNPIGVKRHQLMEFFVKLAHTHRVLNNTGQQTSVVLKSLLLLVAEFYQSINNRQIEREKLFWTSEVE